VDVFFHSSGVYTVVNRLTLEHEARKTRASATTGSIEDHDALATSEVVRELSEAVQDEVHDLLADRVVTAGEIIPMKSCSEKRWR